MSRSTNGKQGRVFDAKMRRRFVQAANASENAAAQIDLLSAFGDPSEAKLCDNIAVALRRASTMALQAALAHKIGPARRPARKPAKPSR